MRSIFFISLVLPLGCWFLGGETVFSTEKAPVAIVKSVEGNVEIGEKKVEEGAWLFEGDIIILSPQSHIAMSFFPENQIQIAKDITVEKRIQVLVTKEDFEIMPEASFSQSQRWANFMKGALSSIRDLVAPQERLGQELAAREEYVLQFKIADLVTPVGTKIMTHYPHFVWSSLPDVNEYIILIFDGLGEIVWRYKIPTTASETQIYTYPKEAPTLKPGEYYFWQVSGGAGESPPNLRKNLYATLGTAYFTVMEKEEIEEIHRTVEEAQQAFDTIQSGNFNLFLGGYYESRHLYGDAQKKYEKLMTLDPTNDLYKSLLANVYIKIGRKWAATELLQE